MLQNHQTTISRPSRSNASNIASGAKSLPGVGVLQQKAGDIVQMVVTEEVTVPIPDVAQRNANSCWAAVGWSIHRFKGGTAYTTERNFVQGQGSATARSNYTADQVNDIDSIIGSTSNNNRLKGSDVDDPFSKVVISKTINKGEPIVANVNNDHYVIICGKRKDDGVFQLQIMDPATGAKTWETLNTGAKISTIGGYSLSVLYYVK